MAWPRFRRVEEEAPVRLNIELWPKKLKARATLVRDGQARDIEASAPIVALIVQFLKPYLKS